MKPESIVNHPIIGMTRREFLRRSTVFAVTSALYPSMLLARAGGSARTFKNIVFIVSDQHRYDVTGCYGNTVVNTPNIDSLANEGVRFDNMYCQFPVCVPSRQSIIRSQYASEHGTRTNVVPEGEETLVDHVNDTCGYTTMLSGKSHMTTDAFDECIDEGNLDSYLTQEIRNARASAEAWYCAQYEGLPGALTKKKINSEYLLYPLVEQWHSENLFVDVLEQLLTAHPERPVFLWVSFPKPHPWWTPPERFWQQYLEADVPAPEPVSAEFVNALPTYLKLNYYGWNLDLLEQEDITNSVRAYYACTEYMDYCVGLILDLLEVHGLVEDTLVVYTSDHGEMLGHNGLYFKGCFYEPAVHVPCVMRFPGVIQAGQVVGQYTELIDLMPTLFDYAGMPVTGTEQGASMRDLIVNPADPNWKNEAFSEVEQNYIMIRSGPWKYNYFPNDTDQLFDLTSDPDEVNNLVGDHQYDGVVNYLLGRISERFGITISGTESRKDTVQTAVKLYQNYPNPFNPITTIPYEVPCESPATLGVYSVQGQSIRVLASGKRSRGYHEAVWDGKDAAGRDVASGVYFAQLRASGLTRTRRMVLAR